MADDKFKARPAAPTPATTVGEIILFVILLMVISRALLYVWTVFLNKLTGGESFAIWWEKFLADVEPMLPLIRALALLVSGIFVLFILYCVRETNKIIQEEKKKLYPDDISEHVEGQAVSVENKQWTRIIEHINSSSPSEHRLAILEADIMLDDLLDSLGYRGESMSEKLKSIEKSDFLTLDLAWEAHKIRNKIAHEGGDYVIDEREARRVISMYEQVFKEFKFI